MRHHTTYSLHMKVSLTWNAICRHDADLECLLGPQADDEGLQGRALQALHSITKGARTGASMPLPAVQAAFQEGGGLPRLVTLLDTAATPKRGGHRSAITSSAVNALAAMTRNSPSARCACEGLFSSAVPWALHDSSSSTACFVQAGGDRGGRSASPVQRAGYGGRRARVHRGPQGALHHHRPRFQW